MNYTIINTIKYYNIDKLISILYIYMLGFQSSKNALYKKQINDILNEDRNINKVSFDMSKRQVAMMTPETISPAVDKINAEQVNSFQVTSETLNRKLEELNNKLTYVENLSTKPTIEKLEDIIKPASNLSLYNNLIRLMNSVSSTQSQKELFYNYILKNIVPYLESITTLYKEIIERIINDTSSRATSPSLLMLPQIISSYTLYLLMLYDLNNKRFKILTLDDVRDAYTKVIQKQFPKTKDIETILKQSELTTNDKLIEQAKKLYEEEYGVPMPKDKVKQIVNRYNPIYDDGTLKELESAKMESKPIIAPIIAPKPIIAPIVDKSLKPPVVMEETPQQKRTRQKEEEKERKQAEKERKQAEKERKQAEKERKEEEKLKAPVAVKETKTQIKKREAEEKAEREETKRKEERRKKAEKEFDDMTKTDVKDDSEGEGRKYFRRINNGALSFNDDNNNVYKLNQKE